MLFDGALGDPHSERHLALGQALEFPQREGLAALGRKRRHHLEDVPQLALGHGLILRGRRFGGMRPVEDLEADQPAATSMLQDHALRRPEDVGARRLDMFDAGERRQRRIGLLDHIVDLKVAGRARSQPQAQSRLMRKDVTRDPRGSLS